MEKYEILDYINGDLYKSRKIKSLSQKKRYRRNLINKVYSSKESSYIIYNNKLYKKCDTDSTEDKLICDFFIIPRYEVKINYGMKNDRYILMNAFCKEKNTWVSFVIKKNDLNDRNWVDNKLPLSKFKLHGDYEDLKKAITIIINSKLCKKYEMNMSMGWIYNREKGKWKYNVLRRCWDCRPRKDEGFSYFFSDLFNTISIDSKENCFKIFLYGLLSIQNEFLKKASIEPKFILNVIGGKEDFVTHIVEFFASSMNVEKGSIQNCVDKEKDSCLLYNDEFIVDSLDNPESIENMLIRNKDKIVVLDFILRKDVKGVIQNIRSNYRKKGVGGKNSLKYNALPIILTENFVKIQDEDFLYGVEINGSKLNIDKLSELKRKDFVLNRIIYKYINWLSEEINYDEEKFLTSMIKKYRRSFRKIYYDNIRLKESEASILALLVMAFKSYLKFGIIGEYIDDDEAEKLYNKGYYILTGNSCNEYELQTEEGTSELEELYKRKNYILYKVINIIKHIYDNDKDKLCTNKEMKDESQIGWLINNKKRGELLYIEFEKINSILNKYIEDNKSLNEDNVVIDFELIKDLFADDPEASSIIYMNNGNRIVNKLNFNDKNEGSNSKKESKEKGSASCLAFKMEKVIEFLNK